MAADEELDVDIAGELGGSEEGRAILNVSVPIPDT